MSVLFGTKQCLDPKSLAVQCRALQIPTGQWEGKANHFKCEAGCCAGQGWLLLPRSAMDAPLDLNLSYTLTFADALRTVALKSIHVVTARCVVPGARGDPNGTYLVEVADRRRLYAQLPIDKAYNVRSYPGATTFRAGSLNSGSLWTWETLVASVWNAVGTGNLGAYPGLPFAPNGTPEGFVFFGSYAMEALGVVLDRLGCTLRLNLFTDTFSIVRVGSADVVALAAEALWDDRRSWDEDWIEPAQARLPQFVRVLFQRQPKPLDGSSVYYVLDVADLSPVAGVSAGTRENVHDDLPALGASGTPTNAAALATRAAERAADWFRLRKSGEARGSRSYLGAANEAGFLPGSLLRGWAVEDRGEGVKISIMRSPRERELPLTYPSIVDGVDCGTCDMVFYSEYMHLDAPVVALGDTLTPGQLIGTIAALPTANAHLHFGVGDGVPFLDGTTANIGQTIDLSWLEIPEINSHAPGVTPPGVPIFTAAQIKAIHCALDWPVRRTDGTWVALLSSPAHSAKEYFAYDINLLPIAADADIGKDVINACVNPDIITTVVDREFIDATRGWLVILCHRCNISLTCATGSGPPIDPDPPSDDYIDVVTNVCPIFATSGSGSGSGSGGGGAIQRTSLGSVSSATTPATIAGITVVAGAKLLVAVGNIAVGSVSLPTVTFDGTSMVQDGNHQDFTESGLAGTVALYSLTVGATTTGNVVVTGTNGLILAVAVEVENLSVNSFNVEAEANGALSTPDTGTTPTTLAADEYCFAAFLLDGAAVGTPGNGFTTGGQDVSGSLSAITFTLTECYRILSAIGTAEAVLNGITPTVWAGCLNTYR